MVYVGPQAEGRNTCSQPSTVMLGTECRQQTPRGRCRRFDDMNHRPSHTHLTTTTVHVWPRRPQPLCGDTHDNMDNSHDKSIKNLTTEKEPDAVAVQKVERISRTFRSSCSVDSAETCSANTFATAFSSTGSVYVDLRTLQASFAYSTAAAGPGSFSTLANSCSKPGILVATAINETAPRILAAPFEVFFSGPRMSSSSV